MSIHIPLFNIMTTNLTTVSPRTTMDKIELLFQTNNFHHIPVVDENNKILGLISKSDYLMLCDSMTLFNEKEEREYDNLFFGTLYAEEVMTKQLAKLRPTDTLSIALGFFKENLFHAIPIVDEENHLLGLVTTFDLINYAYNPSNGIIPEKASS